MRTTFFTIVFALVGVLASAQTAHFSQFYSNPLYLAPSFAGSSENSRFILNYREQWARLPGHFTSYSFSADHFFSKYNSGMGLMFFTDQAGGGKMVTSHIAYLYSYKIRVTYDFYLQPGISAYYYSRSTNTSLLNFSDQFNAGTFPVGGSPIPTEQVQHADFAFSVMGYTENFWGGFNLNHLMSLSPILREDFRYPDLYFSIYGGMKIITKWTLQNRNNETLHLAFNYRNQSRINQLDIGGYYFKKPIYFGVWYRGLPIGNEYSTSDAIIFLLGMKYNKMVINYSYDMSLGSLISTTGGSHEVSLIYYIQGAEEKVSRRKKYRKIPCPTFM